MAKANVEVRQAAKAARLPLWKIAAEMGICEVTLVKRLRFELQETQKSEILKIISRLKGGEQDE